MEGSLIGSRAAMSVSVEKSPLALFISATGPDPVGLSKFEAVTKMFVTDLLWGEEPWLNISTACSFPKPYVSDEVSQCLFLKRYVSDEIG